MEVDDILLVALIKVESKSDNFERIVNVSRAANPETMIITDEGKTTSFHI